MATRPPRKPYPDPMQTPTATADVGPRPATSDVTSTTCVHEGLSGQTKGSKKRKARAPPVAVALALAPPTKELGVR